MKSYCIKPGYICNENAAVYHDTVDNARRYQVAVYRHAADVIASSAMATVLDVGCGVGAKLEEFIAPTGAAITGVDAGDAVEFCRRRYKFGRWFADDIENPGADLGLAFDLIISADVIEHLIDPDTLFRYFRRWSHRNTRVVLSTPERDLRRGPDDMGPPGNDAHVREWNRAELRDYIHSQGFRIEDHRVVDLRPGMRTCQMVRLVCS